MNPRNTGKHSTADILHFPPHSRSKQAAKIVTILPCYENLCMLYAHHALSTRKLFAIRILAWAKLDSGGYAALTPWLNTVRQCHELCDPETGQVQSYYCPLSERQFTNIPEHYRQALDHFPSVTNENRTQLLQEIPDLIGSHAALIAQNHREFSLEPVVSWRLYDDGSLQGMVARMEHATETPVLAGDPCLYCAQREESFRYFFQYHIANQIKAGGEIATRAIQRLIN